MSSSGRDPMLLCAAQIKPFIQPYMHSGLLRAPRLSLRPFEMGPIKCRSSLVQWAVRAQALLKIVQGRFYVGRHDRRPGTVGPSFKEEEEGGGGPVLPGPCRRILLLLQTDLK